MDFDFGKRGGEDIEYYEDTHDDSGNYVGRRALNARKVPSIDQSRGKSDKNSYGNIVVYKPATPEEVETLIDYLKNGEPAVANINDVDEKNAQRILDFLSGAVYALGGNVHRIAGNIFMLSPSGVEIKSQKK